jgi:hypothetical protein
MVGTLLAVNIRQLMVHSVKHDLLLVPKRGGGAPHNTTVSGFHGPGMN